MRKLILFLTIPALLASLLFLSSAPVRADEPANIAEQKQSGPNPSPSPRPGPREGGADD